MKRCVYFLSVDWQASSGISIAEQSMEPADNPAFLQTCLFIILAIRRAYVNLISYGHYRP